MPSPSRRVTAPFSHRTSLPASEGATIPTDSGGSSQRRRASYAAARTASRQGASHLRPRTQRALAHRVATSIRKACGLETSCAWTHERPLQCRRAWILHRLALRTKGLQSRLRAEIMRSMKTRIRPLSFLVPVSTAIAFALSIGASPRPASAQPGGCDVPAPSDVKAPPAAAKKTKSGLASRVLTPGTGKAHPTEFDEVTVRYTG